MKPEADGKLMRIKEPPETTPKPRAQGRREKAEARRARILDAALEEFSNKGFAAARVEDIAQRARVSKGAIYLYFSDKKGPVSGRAGSCLCTLFQPQRAYPAGRVPESASKTAADVCASDQGGRPFSLAAQRLSGFQRGPA